MNIPIRLYKVKKILSTQRNLFISFIIFIFLFVIVFVFYSRFNEQKKEIELMDTEVKMLKNRFDTLTYNKSLTEDQIKEYNKLLASLVPETEDFFSIIYALEEISIVSDFRITDYTITINQKGGEKLTLIVTGSGNAESFLTFLKEYQFAGGRLVTSDKIQFDGGNSGNSRIALNFYNKQFTFNESIQVPQLSKEGIIKLEAIKKKIKFQFSSGGYQTVNTDYSTKKNPFLEEPTALEIEK